MSNRDTDIARRFHELTNHSVQSVRQSTHVMDPDNLPLPYKIYTTLDPIPLPPPGALDVPTQPALDAIAATSASGGALDLAAIARLCYHSNGVTRRRVLGNRAIEFRACACTGALYHMEIYVVCGDLPDLPAGVYHYGAHDHSLRRLRTGDYRRALLDATGGEPSLAEARAVLGVTSTFWRNAWKYQTRAYRHTFWDTGTMLANTLAVASAAGIPATLVLGFADDPVNRLLGADPDEEATVSLVALGRGARPPGDAPPIATLDLPTEPLSHYEIEFPETPRMQRASSLEDESAASSWRGELPRRQMPEPRGELIPLTPLGDGELPREPIEAVVRRRGSTRRFAHTPIGFELLSTALDRATRGVVGDCLSPETSPLSTAYLIVNDVAGLASGAYVLHRDRAALERLAGIEQDRARAVAGRLALGQDLGADAAVNLYWMIDLDPVLQRFANRGYRVAQLDAAITAGKLYLAAYALRVGATGLTFFDDDVTTFFSPHAAGMSVMFLMALGKPRRRR
ncbi:MAG TPA: SagB family peptide dehydrogenase [Thermomicrobiales bacterium]|nr:SagB family peptide dehydrogenase [Thermomicrobiales bacterium]